MNVCKTRACRKKIDTLHPLTHSGVDCPVCIKPVPNPIQTWSSVLEHSFVLHTWLFRHVPLAWISYASKSITRQWYAPVGGMSRMNMVFSSLRMVLVRNKNFAFSRRFWQANLLGEGWPYERRDCVSTQPAASLAGLFCPNQLVAGQKNQR